MPSLYSSALSRDGLMRRVGRLDQVAGVTAGAFIDGPERPGRFLDIRSGGGLDARVLVDRGFDIGTLSIHGVPVGWRSPVGFRAPFLHHADEDSGSGMLRSLDGFLVTCGLDHVRGAAEGPAGHFGPRRATHRYPLHGRIGQTPAQLIGHGQTWQGDQCTLWCEGLVRQAMLYGEVLELHRRIEVAVGGRTLAITDRIVNAGFRPTPFMQLYHVNFGYPMLDAATRLVLPGRPDAEARLRMPATLPEEAEDELFEIAPAPPIGGEQRASIINPGLAGGLCVTLAWTAENLPRLQVWRHLAPGMHVIAIEPATNRAAPRATLETGGEIRSLAPGEVVQHRLQITAHGGAEALALLPTADHA
jgi:hypothetical protein